MHLDHSTMYVSHVCMLACFFRAVDYAHVTCSHVCIFIWRSLTLLFPQNHSTVHMALVQPVVDLANYDFDKMPKMALVSQSRE